jgi:adenylylsulfate kinase-like enzyme
VEKFKLVDAKEQLVMLVTGLAGAGKSTAIEVSRQFCFEFAGPLILFGEKKHFCSLK